VVGFLVLIPIAWAFGIEPRPHLLLFPVCLVLTFTITLGAGLLFSAMNVKYRDVVVIVPFVTLVGLFISPIIYPIDYVPEELRVIYGLNPISGVMELWRVMLFPVPFHPELVLISMGSSLILLLAGLIYYTRAEPAFADVI
jgi:lipopolysaccharide transport system permease protein